MHAPLLSVPGVRVAWRRRRRLEAAMAGAPGSLAALVAEHEKLQSELQALKTAGIRLSAQESESANVQKELQLLEDDAVLYKSVGPVLVRQTAPDAREVVKKRLAFIEGELKKLDKQAVELALRLEGTREKIATAQQRARAKA